MQKPAYYQQTSVHLLLLLNALLITTNVSAQAFNNVSVNGQANIFAAGRSSTDLVGGGLLPTEVALTPGSSRVLSFSSVTGQVSLAGLPWLNGPDGGVTPPGDTNIDSTLGISGIVHTNRNMFLIGVFLNSVEPVDPAPARLSFSDPEDFTSLSPLLHQTFFIGNGISDTGNIVQEFHVPDSATRMFLGFADGFFVEGPPGAYFDNIGELSASFQITTAVPEPGSWVLLFSAFLTFMSYRYWINKRQSKLQFPA